MDPRMAEEFLMLMEQELELELETVEGPRLTQNSAQLLEEQDEEEAEEEQEQEVSLEDGLLFLFQRFIEMREEFPAEECDWYEMDPEERTQLALERVEEVFRKVLEEASGGRQQPEVPHPQRLGQRQVPPRVRSSAPGGQRGLSLTDEEGDTAKVPPRSRRDEDSPPVQHEDNQEGHLLPARQELHQSEGGGQTGVDSRGYVGGKLGSAPL